ncbi:MAG TPA: hypothetical protein VK191_04015 [Symbiobacteriaceae bacterium]|nr:hypothetical protein [Symbiobacteriaceae bacterium]
MGSITTWMRLEPQTRTEDLSRPLQARIHDPLWLLARQWQSGEFHGEDAGTPIQAKVTLKTSGLEAYHPGPVGPGPADPNRVFRPFDNWRANKPLEAVVEGEPVRRPHRPDLRQAAEAGLQLCRLLTKNGVGSVAPLYRAYAKLTPPADLDAATRRFLAVMGKRAPDGDRLYQESAELVRPPEGVAPKLPPLPVIPAAQQAGALVALQEFVDWYETLFAEPEGMPSAWNPERQEYEFAVGGTLDGREVVLTADGYADGHLDWYAFDRHATASLGLSGTAYPNWSGKTMIPVPVTFKGMPANRWWTFEDERVHFGGVEAGKRDLGRLMLGQFATLYGNDWFVIPVAVPAGAMATVGTLSVMDTFGSWETIEPYTKLEPAGSTWRIFHLSERVPVPTSAKLDAPILFRPPTLVGSLQSKPIEEVLFLRDEGANMAWAVERVVEGLLGQPVQRAEEGATAAGDLASTASGLRYRISTSVPDHWTPLLPERLADKRSIRLVRGRLLRALDGEVAPPPKGELLTPAQPLALYEEEVPRAGARVTRQYQYARWNGGSSHLWIGRQKGAGRGEGASGLRFDVVE